MHLLSHLSIRVYSILVYVSGVECMTDTACMCVVDAYTRKQRINNCSGDCSNFIRLYETSRIWFGLRETLTDFPYFRDRDGAVSG